MKRAFSDLDSGPSNQSALIAFFEQPQTPPRWSERNSQQSAQSYLNPAPLTSRNLECLAELSPLSSISDRSYISSTSMASSTKSSPPSLNISAVRQVLINNSMKIEDDDARERHRELLEWAETLVKGDRLSVMKPSSERKAARVRTKYELCNEDTFLAEYIKTIIKDERLVDAQHVSDAGLESHPLLVQIDGSQTLAQELDQLNRSYEEDHLQPNYNQVFLSSSIPTLDTASSDNLVTQLLNQKENRVSKPKPDIVYGLADSAFTERERTTQQLVQAMVRVSPNVNHPFFFLEAKGAEGSMLDAENQACRAGAALVYSHRKLLKRATEDGSPANSSLVPGTRTRLGLIQEAVVFSLCLVPQHACFWVHWAEEYSDKKVIYHMHRLHGYLLTSREAARYLRRDIENILDWGVFNWRRNVKLALSKVEESLIAESGIRDESVSGTLAKKRKKLVQ